jgi:Zn-dependent peptidase ImmA (M78 family)
VTTETAKVSDAVLQLRRVVPVLSGQRGPIALSSCFAETALDHVELPNLTRGSIADYLRRQGIPVEDIGDHNDKLSGFIFSAGRVGWAFVNASDILAKRRFTAAHELGHFVLHRATMGRFRADTDETLKEAEQDVADPMEREANRFAVELLMPAEICHERANELRKKHGCCPRQVLRYRLASELLVSREALGYRLRSLGVGDE